MDLEGIARWHMTTPRTALIAAAAPAFPDPTRAVTFNSNNLKRCYCLFCCGCGCGLVLNVVVIVVVLVFVVVVVVVVIVLVVVVVVVVVVFVVEVVFVVVVAVVDFVVVVQSAISRKGEKQHENAFPTNGRELHWLLFKPERVTTAGNCIEQ